MATISIDIGNSGTRINSAFGALHGYQATIDGQPNPQTLSQFTKAKVAGYIKDTVKQYEAEQAINTARTQAIANVDSQVVIS